MLHAGPASCRLWTPRCKRLCSPRVALRFRVVPLRVPLRRVPVGFLQGSDKGMFFW